MCVFNSKFLVGASPEAKVFRETLEKGIRQCFRGGAVEEGTPANISVLVLHGIPVTVSNPEIVQSVNDFFAPKAVLGGPIAPSHNASVHLLSREPDGGVTLRVLCTITEAASRALVAHLGTVRFFVFFDFCDSMCSDP